MDLNKIILWNLEVAAFLFLPFGLYYSFSESLAFMFGAIWGSANLWMIKELVFAFFAKKKNPLKILFLLTLKFPLLYGGIFALFLLDGVPLTGFTMGFSLVLAMSIIFALRSRLLKKSTLTVLALFAISPLMAGLESEAPEVPNLISLLYKSFSGSPPHWATLLHQWENILFSIGIGCLISFGMYFGIREKALLPKGFQNGIEAFVEGFRGFIIEILGPEGEKYVPFLGTLFIYILCMNWFVLIPLMKSPTASLNVTAGLAITVFVLVQYLNIKNWGIKGFLYHLAGSPKDTMGWLMVPLMLPIEILTQLTRPLTLALRLFGNVLGEDILIGVFAMFGVSFLAWVGAPIGVPLQLPFMFLALLTGLMQALVFTLLSTVYILLSQPNGHVE